MARPYSIRGTRLAPPNNQWITENAHLFYSYPYPPRGISTRIEYDMGVKQSVDFLDYSSWNFADTLFPNIKAPFLCSKDVISQLLLELSIYTCRNKLKTLREWNSNQEDYINELFEFYLSRLIPFWIRGPLKIFSMIWTTEHANHMNNIANLPPRYIVKRTYSQKPSYVPKKYSTKTFISINPCAWIDTNRPVYDWSEHFRAILLSIGKNNVFHIIRAENDRNKNLTIVNGKLTKKKVEYDDEFRKRIRINPQELEFEDMHIYEIPNGKKVQSPKRTSLDEREELLVKILLSGEKDEDIQAEMTKIKNVLNKGRESEKQKAFQRILIKYFYEKEYIFIIKDPEKVALVKGNIEKKYPIRKNYLDTIFGFYTNNDFELEEDDYYIERILLEDHEYVLLLPFGLEDVSITIEQMYVPVHLDLDYYAEFIKNNEETDIIARPGMMPVHYLQVIVNGNRFVDKYSYTKWKTVNWNDARVIG